MARCLPDIVGTELYKRIPFLFTEELSSKNVFLRLPDAFTPIERMLLQANGNLQRILSAYYNVPSRVEIIKNEAISPINNDSGEAKTMQFERKIVMYFGEHRAYEADSVLVVRDQNVLDLIEKHKYGLGQIFGHTRRSPDFVLHAVGRHGTKPGASFWRDYSLTIPEVLDCFVREIFVEGLLEPSGGCQNTIAPADSAVDPGAAAAGTIWVSDS